MVSLHSCESLSKAYDARVFVKTPWDGLTGTHKDAWAEKVISHLKARNITKVLAVSSGNLALAIAAQAQANAIRCRAIVFTTLPELYKTELQKYGAEIIYVTDFTKEKQAIAQAVKQGYYTLSLTLKERINQQVLGSEGYASTANELYHALGVIPDVLIVPASFGDYAYGVLQGFLELQETNNVRVPQFVLVRATLKTGDLARSIATHVTTPQVTYVIKKTAGLLVTLNNEEFLSGLSIATSLGYHAELSSAGAFYALEKLPASFLKNKTVVVLLTAKQRA